MNNNHLITILQNFQKPEASFLQDKECLICLETFDLESNKIVKLPCGCSNSVYHIVCIVQLLRSGENKNFCPHCKTNYEIPLQQQQIEFIDQQLVSYRVINTQFEETQNLQIKKFSQFLLFHILTNSIMNINNIIIARICAEYNGWRELQVLLLFYFCKLFFNYFILIYSKNNINKIEDCLFYSYTFQTILFCFLIYTLTKIKSDTNSTILLLNNILLSISDLAIRIFIEHKINHSVNVIE